MASVADTVVIGGGVIGCALARHLARNGLDVCLVERGEPGAEASSAAAGMLSPLAEADRPGPFLNLLLRSRARFPALASALQEETGIGVGYHDAGTLLLALTDEDEVELQARHAWQRTAGLAVEHISAPEALALEPALSPALRGALRFPGDHQVDNRLLARALWTAAMRAGATPIRGTVEQIVATAGRVEGVQLKDRTRIAAGAVVIAAGSWAGRLGGLARPLPVFPVHGQMLALQTAPPLLTHVVDSPRGYLVPRADGRIIVGTTVEDTGFAKRVTPAGLVRLLGGALEMVPSLAGAALVESWSGLRPGTPDHLPILGGDPQVRNLFYATGHFRNGILLVPVTAEAVGALVLGQPSPIDLAPFAVERFP